MLGELKTDFDKAEYLFNLLVARATGGLASDEDYLNLRKHFINSYSETLLPRFLRTNRNLDQYWEYIKNKFPSYAERRAFLRDEFEPLLSHLETGIKMPAVKSINEILNELSSDNIHLAWQRALTRKDQDPEGAITLSRTILEATCKHILHERQIQFNEKNIELSDLYKLTAKELNLAPEQHTEQIFKQILGGCSGIVNGLGLLRNSHGDAHGASPKSVRPKSRHAELAVNLAGSMAAFLMQTHKGI